MTQKRSLKKNLCPWFSPSSGRTGWATTSTKQFVLFARKKVQTALNEKRAQLLPWCSQNVFHSQHWPRKCGHPARCFQQCSCRHWHRLYCLWCAFQHIPPQFARGAIVAPMARWLLQRAHSENRTSHKTPNTLYKRDLTVPLS